MTEPMTPDEMDVLSESRENDGSLEIRNELSHAVKEDVTATIDIHRPVYTQEQFDMAFGKISDPTKSAKEQLVSKLKKSLTCTKTCFTSKILTMFPFINIMKTYKWKSWLVNDIIAGLSVGVIHIPQSMGFSLLTSLPPVYGLYSTIYPLLIYFFFGSSRHISVGTMAVISLMIGGVVEREAAGFVPTATENDSTITEMLANETAPTDGVVITADDELIEFKVGIATSVTLMVGIIQIGMYLLNLGVLGTFMSMPFIGGFITGAACHIATSQVPFMLGVKPPLKVGAFRLLKTWYWIFRLLGDTNIAELVISILCIVILFIFKEIINEKYKDKLKVPIPAEIIVVGLGILVSYFADLDHRFHVRIIADVPTGLPAPEAPSMYNSSAYIADAFAIALVSYVISMSLAKVFAQKFQYDLDQNQELLAHGLMHSISSFFFCFGGAQAPPRTLVHVNTGGKTQVAGLVCLLMVLLVCIFLGPIIEPLPNCVLAAVISVALLPLFKQFKDLPGFFRINKADFVVWIVSFLAVVIIDVDYGLYIGIGTNLFMIVLQTKVAGGGTLSQAGNTELFGWSKKFPSLIHAPCSIKVFRFDSPLCFTNVDSFKSELFASTANPHTVTKTPPDGADAVEIVDKFINNNETTPLKKVDKVVGIVLDCAAIFYVDVMGLAVLKQVKQSFSDAGISFVFANCNEQLIHKMILYEMSVDEYCFPSIQDAVRYLQAPSQLSTISEI